jgi:hypothetical protein
MVFLIQSGDIPTGTEWMNNMNTNLRQNGRTLIRQLQDRDVDFSAQGKEFAEAYNLSINQEDGRGGSVDLTLSNGYSYSYNSVNPQSSTLTKFIKATHNVTDLASGDTTSDPDSFTNPENAFDEDLTTFASDTGAGSLGKTFAAEVVDSVFVKASAALGVSVRQVSILLESYNGSTWDLVETLLDSSVKTEDNSEIYTVQKLVVLETSVQGLRVRYTGTDIQSTKVYSLAYGDPAAGYVQMAIPSGTFSSTVSSVIGVPLIEDWEADADIQYKFTGTAGAEDTGWLACANSPLVSTFTAFTAEPDTLIVKLIPKTTSPTAGFPSIKGFAVFE